jgi:lysozyme
MQARNSNDARGIDVSHYDGTIDWQQVKNAGITFAYIKATEGTTLVDDRFQSNVAEAIKAGIAVGAYHFCRASDESGALEEAKFFIQTVNQAGGFYLFRLPPALDMETDNGGTRASLTAAAHAWLNEVNTASGRTSVIYTYPFFADNYLDDSLSNVPLWLANYDNNQPANHAGWAKWTFLQYTDQGSVPGIDGSVDMDEFAGTVDDLLGSFISAEDANKIIPFLAAAYYAVPNAPAAQAEFHRLANALRVASGQPQQ